MDPGGWECDVVNVGIQQHLGELIRQQHAADKLLAPKGLFDELVALFAGSTCPAPTEFFDVAVPTEPPNALLALLQRQ
jgi:hypothetical protein